jgi:O-antigen ligase
VLYLYVYVVSMIWHSAGYSRIDLQREQGKLLFLFFQLMLVCWTGYNVMREQRTAQAALLTLAASCIILAVIHILGFARTSTEVASNIERLSTFGQNPNTLARHLSFGALTLVGLGYGRRKRAFAGPIIVWPFVLLILMAIESTGARGGVIALGAGLLFLGLGGEGPAERMRNIVIVALAISFAVWLSFRSETMVQRFEKSIDEGSMAQRENLYPVAWKMFLDRPLLGWGPTLNMWELGSRVGETDHPFRDTHNLLLEVLTVTGVVGAIPFFAGIFLCLLSAWNSRAGPEGVLPLAAIVAILVANVGANLHYNKLFWLVLAYALASGHRRLHVLKDAQKPRRLQPLFD